MKLYSYWRSSTSYRLRAALNLKGMTYETVPVDLVAGEQRAPEYLALNSIGGVPSLVLDDGTVLTQSLAIIDYLDQVQPDPALLPADPIQRAQQIAAAMIVATDIHPVNNLKVIGQLKARFGASAEEAQDWMCHWMIEGFAALESQLDATTSFAFGKAPGLADICLIAQVYNARRWGVDLNDYPRILRVEAACLANPAIAAAHPDLQPDAPAS